MSEMAILQQLHSRGYNLGSMLSRKWCVLAFVLALICVVSHRCVAGPIPRTQMFCIARQELALTNPFPRAASFRQSPTSMLRSNEINLSRITTPPEFRVHDPKAANTKRVILQTQPWPPPCPVLPENL